MADMSMPGAGAGSGSEGHQSMEHAAHDGPNPFYLERMYWAVVGSAIGVATLANLCNRYLAFQRLRNTAPASSSSKRTLSSTYTALTALIRNTSNTTLPPWSIRGHTWHSAPLGPVALILGNLITILVLCFYQLDTTNWEQWVYVALRAGFITVCQLPLLFLLAGRLNIIGALVGSSYEHLNWFHRWAARTLWLTATLHMGFWFRAWNHFNGEYIRHQLRHDPTTQRGFAAWCILTFIVVSSAAPLRRLSYEFFVLQHLVTFVGFLVAVYLHVKEKLKVWVWISIGLLVFDRLVRYTRGAYANLAVFHRARNRNQAPRHSRSLWANRASFTPLTGNVTRITIDNPGVTWTPGQHVFLTCHSLLPLQSHPFTIASIPADGRMEFFVRAEKGGTRRFFRHASNNHHHHHHHHHELYAEEAGTSTSTQPRTVFVEGPYGRFRPLRQFHSVVLVAGGMGATFILPCLRDLVARWKDASASASETAPSRRHPATQRIRVVWAVKTLAQASLFEEQLKTALADVAACQRGEREPDLDLDVDLEVSIHVTRDERLDSGGKEGIQGSEQALAPEPEPMPMPIPMPELSRQDSSSNKELIKDEDTVIEEKAACSSSGQNSPRATRPETSTSFPPAELAANHSHSHSPAHTHTDEEDNGDGDGEKKRLSGPQRPQQQQPEESQLQIFPGRPDTRAIIHSVVANATGESAVVVCGPESLSEEVRRSARAGGKYGVYLHIEKFGW